MKIVVVRGQEEWEGLYVDGQLAHQQDSLYYDTLLEIIVQRGEPVTSYERFTTTDAAEERLMDVGCFPDTLDEYMTWAAD